MVLIKTTIDTPNAFYVDNVLVSSQDGTIIYNVPNGVTDIAPLYKIKYNYSTGTGTLEPPLAQQTNWIDICCSADGSKIIAIYKDVTGELDMYKFFAFNNDQQVYDDFFPKNEANHAEIHSCAMSYDGNVVYLGGKACVYKLTNIDWTSFTYDFLTGEVINDNPNNLGVHHICCSGNGEIGWCGLDFNQSLSIYKLEMVDETLTSYVKKRKVMVSGITCNESGAIVAASDYSEFSFSKVYISKDSGDNWTETNTVDNGGTLANNSVHLSNSGQRIIVGVTSTPQNGFLDYTYDVGGALKLTDGSNGAPLLSLTSTTQTGDWSSVGISGDGNKFFGVIYDNEHKVIILNWYSGPTPPTPPTPSPIPLPISDICFIAGTPIVTNQGIIPIEKINPKIHTIRNKKIIAITQTISQDDYLVCFEQNSLGPELPTKKTIMSKDHKLFYKGKIAEAQNFLGKFNKVTKITYNGEILYNVLMDECYKINVNNLTCETLDPENVIAKLYTEYYDENYKKNIIIKMNDSILKQDYPTYKNLVKSIMKK